jgi:hypothetical protein
LAASEWSSLARLHFCNGGKAGNCKAIRVKIAVSRRANFVKRSKSITYDAVRRVALTFPNVEESTSYGTPALKVKGKLFVRWRNEEDPDTIVLKMPFDQREELMAADPETYFITDHYRNYPWVLVRLSKVHPDAVHELLHIGYSNASPARRRLKASPRSPRA